MASASDVITQNPVEEVVAGSEEGTVEEPTKVEESPEAMTENKPSENTTVVPSVENSEREASPAISEGSVEEVAPAAPAEPPTGTTQKPHKEGSSKSRRKDEKGSGKDALKHVLKALNSLESTEEKLAALCTKYTELLEEHRLMQNKFKQNQRKMTMLSREKDQLQNEQSKTVLAKSKLENLCRELQRHNKLIKDESVARAKEEEEKRKEVTAKFQTTINDIQRQMNENYEKNNKLREENMELATKLKNLIEQYELREQHIEKVFKHKELEQQLVDAKLAQATMQMTEEKERNIKEKQLLLEAAGHSHQKVELLEAQETQLRNQVALYTEKYEEFQSTLAKSNEVFQSFKTEMDKMTKKIKKLEKETTMWRTRWENSNKALLNMAEEKTRSDKEISLLNSKVQKLESLCRALQEERKKLASKVKSSGASAEGGDDSAQSEGKTIEPTKTPPNTPNAGSRGSPVTVRPESNGPRTESSQSRDSSQEGDQSQAVLTPESVTDKLEAVLNKEQAVDQSEATAQPESEETTQSGATEQPECGDNSQSEATTQPESEDSSQSEPVAENSSDTPTQSETPTQP